jgi:hypothetical protein
MADVDEGVSGEAGVGHERARFTEHLDIAIVLLILIALFVCALQAVGRHVGNSTNSPGVTAFFGG